MPETIPNTALETAIDRVQRAYAEGRITESELEHRLDLILTARSLVQVRLAIADLPASPVVPVTASRAVAPAASGRSEAGALIHLSALISGPILPGLAYMVAETGSPAHREATKALNFQILAIPAFMATTLLMILGIELPAVLWGITWLAVTVLGAVKSHRGEDWENPITRATGFRPVTGSRRDML